MKLFSFPRISIVAFLALCLVSSCTKKLDLFPTNDVPTEAVFKNFAGYQQAAAKFYASMAVTGSPSRDIPAEIVSDEGSTGFLRQFWYLECLSTDEAGWTYSGNTDPIGIHQIAWSPANQTVAGSYYRCFYTITLCNNFIQQASDDNLSKRGITGTDADNIRKFKQEARFIRAYNYWVLLDLFGNVPFVDENYAIASGELPKQMARKDLFAYIESELKSLETTLPNARTAPYGRVDKGAAWALLARLYLNAGVYSGADRYTDAITYAKKIFTAGYSLHNNYKELMLADNNLNTDEFIWTIQYDGTSTQSYSGTTFLVHGPAGVTPDTTGTGGTWGCIRMTEQFVNKFDAQDIRGQFWTLTQKKEMDTLLGTSTNGYSSTKFRNKTRSGQIGPHIDAGKTFVDIDMPLFRLAEVYLIYAEAVLRGGSGGDNTTALNYLKALAVRARPADPSASSYPQLSLQYIIDERGRELFWEGHRRTDLIRFGQFTTSAYLWAWKGGVRNGTPVESKYNLFPIPATDISANPNLVQNPGY